MIYVDACSLINLFVNVFTLRAKSKLACASKQLGNTNAQLYQLWVAWLCIFWGGVILIIPERFSPASRGNSCWFQWHSYPDCVLSLQTSLYLHWPTRAGCQSDALRFNLHLRSEDIRIIVKGTAHTSVCKTFFIHVKCTASIAIKC